MARMGSFEEKLGSLGRTIDSGLDGVKRSALDRADRWRETRERLADRLQGRATGPTLGDRWRDAAEAVRDRIDRMEPHTRWALAGAAAPTALLLVALLWWSLAPRSVEVPIENLEALRVLQQKSSLPATAEPAGPFDSIVAGAPAPARAPTPPEPAPPDR